MHNVVRQPTCQLAVVFAVAATPSLLAQNRSDSSPIVLGLIGLFGVLITALVSLLGVSIKHALDRRTEARIEMESERNAIVARDAERRLKLDTAIRAIQTLPPQLASLLPRFSAPVSCSLFVVLSSSISLSLYLAIFSIHERSTPRAHRASSTTSSNAVPRSSRSRRRRS